MTEPVAPSSAAQPPADAALAPPQPRGFGAAAVLVREPRFNRLLTALMASWSGLAMAPIALAFGVLELTGSAQLTGWVVAAQTTAQILTLLLGGVIADRVSRRRVLIAADAVATFVQGALAVVLLSGTASVGLLLGLVAVNGVALAFHAPALTGFIPEVVPRVHLQPANALLGTARSAARALGPALVGVVIAAFGAGVAMAVNALLFMTSALCVATIRLAPGTVAPSGQSLFGELREGWREFTAHRWLWVIVLQFSLVVAGVYAVEGLLGPAIARSSLGGATAWGYIAAAAGVGTMVGGVLAMHLQIERTMLVATCCVFGFASTGVLLALTGSVALIAGGAFVGGIAGQMFGVLWNTTLQRRIPPHLLSRVSAYDQFGSIALAPVGLIVAGYLLDVHGAAVALWTAVLLVVVPTALALLDRDVRTMRLSGSA